MNHYYSLPNLSLWVKFFFNYSLWLQYFSPPTPDGLDGTGHLAVTSEQCYKYRGSAPWGSGTRINAVRSLCVSWGQNNTLVRIKPEPEQLHTSVIPLRTPRAQKKPAAMMNGQMNGFHNSLIDEDCFLFTSESVGEGHPGKSPASREPVREKCAAFTAVCPSCYFNAGWATWRCSQSRFTAFFR